MRNIDLFPLALPTKIFAYLEENILPFIKEEQMEEFDSEFTIEELQSAIRD